MGPAFRCFICDKLCHGVRYHVPDQDTSTACWSPEESETLPKAASTGSQTASGEEVQEVLLFGGDEDSNEIMPSLRAWLEHLQLGHHLEKAMEWCQEMGAAEMDEIRENWEDFAEHLGLSDEEREYLAEACQPQDLSPLPALAASKSRETFGPEAAPYVMQEKLGQGATATVYRCKRGEEEFAVKVIDLHRFCLHPGFDKLRQQIMREMSLLLMLQHRNIVKLVDVSESSHTFFMVMELVRGGDLSEYLLSKPDRHMDDREACHVFLQIVDGLCHIHSKNIVHRDLKPQNILLVDRPEEVRDRRHKPKPVEVKLSDFGHSKLVRDGYTFARSHVGTPQYLAPEVASISKCNYDERADLWSLGVVLYVMLTGQYPFRSSEDPAYHQGRFSFRGSGRAEELMAGLIRRRPEDRMPLEQCLLSAWVQSNRPKAPPRIPRQITASSLAAAPAPVREFRIRLPKAPKKVSDFKSELDMFSLRHKVSASLQLLEVVVTFTDGPEGSMETAWSELWELLHRNCPALKKCNGMFPDSHANSPMNMHSDPMLDQEQEALNSIYGADFEALSDYEWLVNVGQGTFLRVNLPGGYPGTEPPAVQVECPHGTAPSIQQSLENCWTPGEVCVFEMVECLRAAVEPACAAPPTEGSGDETPSPLTPAKVVGSSGRRLTSQNVSFEW
ncbi:unnamed protein product [Effrenium voratum]|uniref:Protein kinase domain-containing protein n=1 Tax=Effrenium voratum TaxID=2562239 RepID=A0AA36NGC9_9DINO|nr:unnamed protein product [Effrenium voratum]